MEETPKSYKWLWWLLGGVAALGAGFAAWFFFFRKPEQKDNTDNKKDETKDETKAETPKVEPTKTPEPPENAAATEPVKQTNPPPKTAKPKGDVWEDVFVGSKSNKLRTTNKRSLKLVQTATNEALKKAGRKNLTCSVDGVWGPKTEAAVSAVLGIIFTQGPTFDLLKYKESAGGYTVSTYLSNVLKYLSNGKYQMGDMNGLKESMNKLTDVQKAIILKQ